jgi:hypothetical protein
MLEDARSLAFWSVSVTIVRPAAGVLGAARDTGGRAAEAALDGIADRLLQGGLAERFVTRLLEAPEVERLLGTMLDSPGMERLVTRAIQSRLTEDTMARLIEDAITRLPQTQALWALVDEVARSEAVSDAITQQGLGLADEVAEDLRERSRDADAWLERTARRVLRRRGGGPAGAGGVPAPQMP